MIVVTGGAGFIGSNLVAALEKRALADSENKSGLECIISDWLGTDEKWRNIAKRDLYDFVYPEDLMDFLEENRKQITMIYHMGAISATTETDVDLIMRRNVKLSQQLWQWCVTEGVRFIYASSAATYGDGHHGFIDREDRGYLQQLQPLNAYGWSKALFDRQIARDMESGRPRPPQWVGLKFFNVYGPNEYHKGGQKSVVAHLVPQIQETGKAKLFKSHVDGYEDGGQLRDFVSVDDCVDIMLWLYDNPDVSGLFNIGTGQARSFADLARAVFKAMDIPENIEYIDMPAQLRPNYQYFTQADMTNLRQAGYQAPMRSLEEGIANYVKAYLLQSDAYR